MKRLSVAALSFLCCSFAANAQDVRDPTQPPVAPQRSSAAMTGSSAGPDARVLKTLGLVGRPLVLVERHGRLHVVFDARLYAEGERFGAIEIVRIRETEVWFRDGGALYKMSRFPNVRRQPAALPKKP